MKKLAALALVAPLAGACGGNGGIDLGDGGDAGVITTDASQADAIVSSDATADVAVEAGAYGAPSTTYPAFTPWMGQLSKNGGPILSAFVFSATSETTLS